MTPRTQHGANTFPKREQQNLAVRTWKGCNFWAGQRNAQGESGWEGDGRGTRQTTTGDPARHWAKYFAILLDYEDQYRNNGIIATQDHRVIGSIATTEGQ